MDGQSNDDYLYDPEILTKHNLGERYDIIKHDESLLVRPLRESDYDRGFLQLLEGLTEVGNVSREQFSEQFNLMKSSNGIYYTTVIVDTTIDRIVAASTLFMERKFIRGCALVGVEMKSLPKFYIFTSLYIFIDREHDWKMLLSTPIIEENN